MAEISFQPTRHELTISPKTAAYKGTLGSFGLSILRVKEATGNSNRLNILSGVSDFLAILQVKKEIKSLIKILQRSVGLMSVYPRLG